MAPLARFVALRRLHLEGQTRDLDVVGQLHTLTSLTLRSITLPDLSLLLPLNRLRALDLKLGGTRNLALLPQVGALQYLELWLVRGLHDLSPVGDVPTLEYLFLQALKQVDALPSFANCTRLTRLHLEAMKGLVDLTPLLTAKALTQLTISTCHSCNRLILPFSQRIPAFANWASHWAAGARTTKSRGCFRCPRFRTRTGTQPSLPRRLTPLVVNDALCGSANRD